MVGDPCSGSLVIDGWAPCGLHMKKGTLPGNTFPCVTPDLVSTVYLISNFFLLHIWCHSSRILTLYP